MNKQKQPIPFEEPREIFLQAEAVLRTVFNAEDQAKVENLFPDVPKHVLLMMNVQPQKSHFFRGLLSVIGANQALALELYLKCLKCNESGAFLPIHNLLSLYDDLSDSLKGRILVHHNEIAKTNPHHKKFEKISVFTTDLRQNLEMGAIAYEKYRYLFVSDNKYLYLQLSDTIHACRRVLKEEYPDWPIFNGLM